MTRCSKCNNELVADARFCNICGTPVSTAPAAPTDQKRAISPDIRHVLPTRDGRPRAASPAPDLSQNSTPIKTRRWNETPNKPADTTDNLESDAPDTIVLTPQKQNIPRPSIPPIIPKTIKEFPPAKAGQAGASEKQNPAPVDVEDASTTTDSPDEVAGVTTSSLPDESLSESDKDETVPLPNPELVKNTPVPAPNSGPGHAQSIIRPIGPPASSRQDTPVSPGQTPPNPMSPLPALPNTPTLTGEKTLQKDNAKNPWPVQSDNRNYAIRQQNTSNAGVPQTPLPAPHNIPANYPEGQKRNNNGANSTANRQELPLYSPESFAYTSKAAEHWRGSWRDLQNAEAGPAEDVSKGQASVPAPLAARKESFLRLRAIRSKQNQDAGERNFGFWVTLFLMICLIGGLAAYIVYSYLPGTSGADRIAQPAGVASPSFSVVGTPSQVFTGGQSLRAHGEHFGANDSISFLLDSTAPVLASNGSPLNTQADNQGTFDVTILVDKIWAVGAHIITATDARANLSAYLDIQVNPGGSPVTTANNTDLTFTLNGQPIDHLSFTAQVGQPAPTAQRITFTNASGAPVQWTAAASAANNLNWLNIVDSDYAGQLDISQPHTMGIGINPAGLSVSKAPYSGQIVFTINGNQQLTMPVQLTIMDATPEMVFSPNPLVATANANGTCQAGATLTFINLGTTVISWSANPDLQNNIQFVNNQGIVNEHGSLQPSGTDGDTAVVTLRCNGVKAGDKYLVHVFANSVGFSETVFIE
ncbi:MAG: zinc-ribbon domain-containing protein [Ktedonobacteraceae bacterium]